MDLHHDTTKHEKNKHLTYAERVIIQVRTQDGWSAYRIAKELGCAANTVRNELRRGRPDQYYGKAKKYLADDGQSVYEGHRLNCRRTSMVIKKRAFLKYVDIHFREDHWSLDACQGRALESREFSRSEVVCTKTLYNYVNQGLLKIKNIDLPQKLKRKPRRESPPPRKNKRLFGRSIEQRDPVVASRSRFGDWEADLVIGRNTGKDKVLLTLLERKTDYYHVIQLKDKTSASVMQAFDVLKNQYKEDFARVFKTITTDNGSEFSRLPELEAGSNTQVYYAHPFSSWEKGSNERHNGLLRRFIPKGSRIDKYTEEDIERVMCLINATPRKRMNYKTPKEKFRKELRSLSILA